MSVFKDILTETVVTSLYDDESDFELLLSPFIYMYEFDGLAKALNAFTFNMSLSQRTDYSVGNVIFTDLILEMKDTSTRIDDIVRVRFDNDFSEYIESVGNNLIDPYIIENNSIDSYKEIYELLQILLVNLFTNMQKGSALNGIDLDHFERMIKTKLEKGFNLASTNVQQLSEEINTPIREIDTTKLFEYLHFNDTKIEHIRRNITQLNDLSYQTAHMVVDLLQSISIDGDNMILKVYQLSPTELRYYSKPDMPIVICRVSDIHEFTNMTKYLLRMVSAFKVLHFVTTNFTQDYIFRIVNSEASIRQAMVGLMPIGTCVNYVDELTKNVLINHIKEVTAPLNNIQESVAFIRNYDPSAILNGDIRILREAANDSTNIKNNIDAMKKKVKAFKKSFDMTARELINSNKEWLGSIKEFNTSRIDGTKFEYKMYPYWKTIDDMIQYKIPPFDPNNLDQYSDMNEFRRANFADLLDGEGRPLYQEKFRGGLKEDIRPTKINPTFNKCLRIIKKYTSYSNKVSSDISSLLASLNKASNGTLNESFTLNDLLECNMLEDRLYEALLEASTPKLANKESVAPAKPSIDNVGAAVAWFKECYKIVAAKMVVLEEAHDESIKYIEYLRKAETRNEKDSEVDKKE